MGIPWWSLFWSNTKFGLSRDDRGFVERCSMTAEKHWMVGGTRHIMPEPHVKKSSSLDSNILVEESREQHRHRATPAHPHTLTEVLLRWKNRINPRHTGCLGRSHLLGMCSRAQAYLLLGRTGKELKAWGTLGALSFPVTLQWVCSRPLQRTVSTCGRGHLFYEIDRLCWAMYLTTQPLLWWWGAALSLYWAKSFSFCIRLGKGHVCPKGLSIFYSALPSLHKPCLATTAPTVLMPYMDGHQGLQVTKNSPMALGVGQSWDLLCQRTAPIWRSRFLWLRECW